MGLGVYRKLVPQVLQVRSSSSYRRFAADAHCGEQNRESTSQGGRYLCLPHCRQATVVPVRGRGRWFFRLVHERQGGGSSSNESLRIQRRRPQSGQVTSTRSRFRASAARALAGSGCSEPRGTRTVRSFGCSKGSLQEGCRPDLELRALGKDSGLGRYCRTARRRINAPLDSSGDAGSPEEVTDPTALCPRARGRRRPHSSRMRGEQLFRCFAVTGSAHRDPHPPHEPVPWASRRDGFASRPGTFRTTLSGPPFQTGGFRRAATGPGLRSTERNASHAVLRGVSPSIRKGAPHGDPTKPVRNPALVWKVVGASGTPLFNASTAAARAPCPPPLGALRSAFAERGPRPQPRPQRLLWPLHRALQPVLRTCSTGRPGTLRTRPRTRRPVVRRGRDRQLVRCFTADPQTLDRRGPPTLPRGKAQLDRAVNPSETQERPLRAANEGRPPRSPENRRFRTSSGQVGGPPRRGHSHAVRVVSAVPGRTVPFPARWEEGQQLALRRARSGHCGNTL